MTEYITTLATLLSSLSELNTDIQKHMVPIRDALLFLVFAAAYKAY